MLKRIKTKGIKCAICDNSNRLPGAHNKICLHCYFKNSTNIPKHIPFEQHDIWIIKNHERDSK
jgi:hypothetical protein